MNPPIENFALNVLLLFLCLLPFLTIAPLFWLGYHRRQRILQSIALESFLLQQGFKKASLFQYLTEQVFYILTKKEYSVAIGMRDLPFSDPSNPSQTLLTFLTIDIQMPLRGRFLIRTANLEEVENSLLYEPDWNPTPLPMLAPLGLRVLGIPKNFGDLERRLQSPAIQQALSELLKGAQPFYIYAGTDHFVQLGFGLLRPRPEQARRWLETAAQWLKAFYDPTLITRSNTQRTVRRWWFVTIFVVIVLMLGVLFFLFSGSSP
ncbi:MAG: hypothetical protein DDG59_11800 [Anaerolineae bacterium]|jgi:hypothetical protein|nr:MAG: hypothetical protein DDG59_11800 [Anaerolineae bacterium]